MRVIKPGWVEHEEGAGKLGIYSIDVHPEGTCFATGGSDARVRLSTRFFPSPLISVPSVHLESPTIHSIELIESDMRAIEFSRQNQTLAKVKFNSIDIASFVQ